MYLRPRSGLLAAAHLVQQEIVLSAEFATIGRVTACVLATDRFRYASGVNASSIPHDQAVLAGPSQKRLMDTLPNAGLHPFVKSTPACHATAAAEFARKILPRHSSLDDKQLSSQGRALIDTWPTALLRSSVGRGMGCYARPKVSGRKCLGQGITPSANTAVIIMLGLSPCTSAIDPGRVKTRDLCVSTGPFYIPDLKKTPQRAL
jgi:hypothetical protein